MFGIEDLWVALAYILCPISALACVIYGIVNWNRGEEEIQQEDVQWAAQEDKAEESL